MNLNHVLKKMLIVGLVLVTLVTTSACNVISNITNKIEGALLGDDYKILSYDDYGNNTLTIQGNRVNIGIFDNKANSGADGFKSEVLEITIDGHQLLHVGSTAVFAERGVKMVKDFDFDYLKDITSKGLSTVVPLDRSVNSLKNFLGEEKVIIIKSQLGVVVGVYQGKNVTVEIPTDLPKMTRLIVDGKSLYIYRADYEIMDTALLK
jgi:hypothetical protein